MAVIVPACASFVLTVSEAETEVVYLQTNDGEKVSFDVTAAGQVYCCPPDEAKAANATCPG